ncbi:MAG TPA: BCCT transporter, partial [Pseudomonas sp.]|nr:BCCT transporter [Pseudomonas sp.]
MADSSESPAAGGNLIDTDYQIGQDNLVTTIGPIEVDIHNPVFAISGLMTIVFVIFTLAFPELATGIFTAAMSWVTVRFDWLFILASNIFLVFAVAIALSPYGKVRL